MESWRLGMGNGATGPFGISRRQHSCECPRLRAPGDLLGRRRSRAYGAGSACWRGSGAERLTPGCRAGSASGASLGAATRSQPLRLRRRSHRGKHRDSGLASGYCRDAAFGVTCHHDRRSAVERSDESRRPGAKGMGEFPDRAAWKPRCRRRMTNDNRKF